MTLARTIRDACAKNGQLLSFTQEALITGCVAGHIIATRQQFVRFIDAIAQVQEAPGDDIKETRCMREADRLLGMLK